MTIKLTGFRELEKKLAEDLPKATARNVLRRVARAALEPMADTAAAKAPERTGKLAYSISVSEGRTRRAKGASKNAFVGGRWRATAATGISIAMGPAGGLGTLYYATQDEFGTIDTAAQPYMRPAWDTGKMQALEYVEDNLWREIERAVGRIAKKAGR